MNISGGDEIEMRDLGVKRSSDELAL